ncbi:MAG: NADH-quinone oxidoreductase subunit C [Dehalococcoidia bacterium]|nr:NADH-quinone oxidoreductase subunit C [Dehalococcoidia bacterium]
MNIADNQELSSHLRTHFGEGIIVHGEYVEITIGKFERVAKYLKESLGYEFLSMITAIDYIDYFELVYRIEAFQNKATVQLKLKCEKVKPVVPSLSHLWYGARLQEREVYDLFGIEFSNHPNLKRIVLWEGFQGYPLRKDFKVKSYDAGN